MASKQESQQQRTDVTSEDSDKDNKVTIDSVTLERLILEVSLEQSQIERSYNRTYNRHNR
jgi:hypothetical protein